MRIRRGHGSGAIGPSPVLAGSLKGFATCPWPRNVASASGGNRALSCFKSDVADGEGTGDRLVSFSFHGQMISWVVAAAASMSPRRLSQAASMMIGVRREGLDRWRWVVPWRGDGGKL